MDHDELGGRIDQDDMSPDAEQRKSALLTGEEPHLVSIAEVGSCRSRGEMTVGWLHRGGVQHPLPWNQLTSFPCAVMRKQPAQTRVVAQGRVKAAEGDLLAGVIDGPGRVGLRADCVPDPAMKIVRKRLTRGSPQHKAQDLGLDAGVVPFGSRWSSARVELGDAGDRVLSGLNEQVACESRDVVLPVIDLRKGNAR